MKKISTQQIEALLQTIYATSIPAAQFDAVKKFFNELPEVKEEVAEEKKK